MAFNQTTPSAIQPFSSIEKRGNTFSREWMAPGIHATVNLEGLAVTDFTVTVQKKSGNGYADYMTYKGKANGTFDLILNPGQYRLVINGPTIQTTTKEITVENTKLNLDFAL